MARPINYLSTEEKILFPQARKRFGFSQLFGSAHFGFMRFGEFNPYAGIYRHTQYYNNRVWQKIAFMWPSNPRTVPQQARRAVFADGITAWHGLSPEDVLYWQKQGKKKRLPAYHAFISNYLYTN